VSESPGTVRDKKTVWRADRVAELDHDAPLSRTAAAVAAADGHLRADLRPGRVELPVLDRRAVTATTRDAELARRIAAAVAGLGLTGAGSTSAESARPAQMLEMAIDATDIAAVRPFWRAVPGYVDKPGRGGPARLSSTRPGSCPRSGFSRWTRPGRSATGCTSTSRSRTTRPSPGSAPPSPPGRLVDDSHARAFWVLADAEGNEACVCTWTDRDEREGN